MTEEMKHSFKIGGSSRLVETDRKEGSYQLKMGGKIYKATLDQHDGSRILLTIDGRRTSAYLAENNDLIHVCIDGIPFIITDEKESAKSESRDYGASGSPAETEVKAPMPGKIIRLFVKPGDKVEEGSKIAILEAMKMENQLVSPKKGKISKVLVSEGHLLEAGQKIVEFEAID